MRACLEKHCKESAKIRASMLSVEADMARLGKFAKTNSSSVPEIKKLDREILKIKKRLSVLSAETAKKCGKVCEAERVSIDVHLNTMQRSLSMLGDFMRTESKKKALKAKTTDSPPPDLRACLSKHCAESKKIQAQVTGVEDGILRIYKTTPINMDIATASNILKKIQLLKGRSDALSAETAKSCGRACYAERAALGERLDRMKRTYTRVEESLKDKLRVSRAGDSKS